MNRMYDEKRAPAYCVLYPAISRIAREFGYACTIHGSLVTDLDVVLIPWVEEAADAADVVEAVRLAIGGVKRTYDVQPYPKPHGRLSWTFYLLAAGETDHTCSTPYVDISVTPSHMSQNSETTDIK